MIVPHFFSLYKCLGIGYQLMHTRNVPIAHGVTNVLIGYPNLKCLNGEAFIRVLYVCIGHSEPLDVAS